MRGCVGVAAELWMLKISMRPVFFVLIGGLSHVAGGRSSEQRLVWTAVQVYCRRFRLECYGKEAWWR